MIEFNEQEQEVLNHISDAVQGLKDMGLEANYTELNSAVHTMQLFVISHMLHRYNPYFSNWYKEEDDISST